MTRYDCDLCGKENAEEYDDYEYLCNDCRHEINEQRDHRRIRYFNRYLIEHTDEYDKFQNGDL